MGFAPIVNDLAHMLAYVNGPAIVFIGSSFLVGSIFWSLTAVTIFMVRSQE